MKKQIVSLLCVVLTVFTFCQAGYAQEEAETEGTYTYRPYSQRMRMEDSATIDTARSQAVAVEVAVADSLSPEEQYVLDSIAARDKFIQDSIFAREQFVRDSIIAREAFVRDSIIRRQQIIDSLTYLSNTLPALLTASTGVLSDDIIVKIEKLQLVGDSTLTNFKYTSLPSRMLDPYKPWISEVNLSDKPAAIEIDAITQQIKNISSPGINDFYTYANGGKIVKIVRQGMFTSKHSKNYYKAPVDSVFLDANMHIVKIKRYYLIYAASANYQRGALLFSFLWQVKQYGYSKGELSSYELIKFCDRWLKSDPVKVCNISKYTIAKQAYTYIVNRSNDPVNVYSDGEYRYEFDNLSNLRSVSFRNTKGSENWKTFVELNEHGYVSRYVYQENGIVNRTLLVNYYLDDPKAKHKVETITCTFEDDGISYFQRNNTTEKSRTRDRMTGEWSEWY